MKSLTTRQQQVLEFIQHSQHGAGLTPTFREIASHFRFQSPNAALSHVQALRAKGYLQSRPGRARSFQLRTPNQKAASNARVISIPIYGTIPAGFPQGAAQEQEGCVLIDVATVGVKPSARTFALKVRGDSMLGKNIVDGDIAIIEHGMEPRSGDVVAALIDGQVTLKTFVLQRGKPYLRAENPRYPALIPREELQIQGVMVSLIRKCK
jgi:repressor LexA